MLDYGNTYGNSESEGSLPWLIADYLGLPKGNIDDTLGFVDNGLFFFNAKTDCAIDEKSRPKVSCATLDDAAPPYWSEDVANYGQPNQLLDKMVRVLDVFYGKGLWEHDYDAKIDLIVHSQGGLIAKIAIAKARDRSLANPVNHINRIIDIDSPHKGSALATSPQSLRKGNSADEDATYSGLANLKDWLFSEESAISLSVKSKLMGTYYIDFEIPVSMNVTGAILGPYQIHIDVDQPVAEWLRFDVPKSWKKTEETRDIEVARQNSIIRLANDAKYLAWPDESQYMADFHALPYPTLPYSGENIATTHFDNGGMSVFFGEIVNELSYLADRLCVDALKESDPEHFLHWEQSCRILVDDLFGGKKNAPFLKDLASRLVLLDKDWSTRSDMVVEVSSQKGINPAANYDEQGNSQFHSKTFSTNKGRILHNELSDVLESLTRKMGFVAATHLGCDIAEELGIETEHYKNTCRKPTTIGAPIHSLEPHTSSGNSAEHSAMSPLYAVKNMSGETLKNGWRLEYYYLADPDRPVDVAFSGADASVTTEHIGAALHKAIIRPSAIVDDGQTWPNEGGFSLVLNYATGDIRDASKDPSRPIVQALGQATMFPVYAADGLLLGGHVPSLDTLDQNVASLYTISVEAMERSGANTITQPSVRIRNEGDLALHGFKMRYTVTSVRKPELRVYWIDRMPNATWKLVELGDHRWAAEFDY
ncbi:MAG: hypothetical protein J6Y56_02850, partial [Fibrobacterales bacterium]|nr:hypothetical protein [Fibrobacterales bacterium]